jgi:hypothetical protein
MKWHIFPIPHWYISSDISEEFEDTKGVLRIHKSKKNRQLNGQRKKDKQRSTKHTHKTKDRVKTRGELRCSRKGKQYLLH